ncbi:expressed unknown protein [Seminavis robusta]|uniref:RDD domain-containing protein n=1 Tax=Seminavis robusta TaxID=568900 RepID=A0A9N8DV30_9STRA|nr:expressed unknown protein [Seminavis robusta]|eukprot:Sro392_g133420.1 n/a (531) ;mRNA; r:41609-43427
MATAGLSGDRYTTGSGPKVSTKIMFADDVDSDDDSFGGTFGDTIKTDEVKSQLTERSINSTEETKSVFARAFGRVVNPLIQVVDLDGVIRQIDLNDVISRVNFNDIVDTVDWNNLAEQVDFDAIFARVDVNALVERIDVNAVIERSNLKSIIARSTTGICFLALDSIRAMCIKGDQIVQRMGRCVQCFWWRSDYGKWLLPPLPTVTPISDTRKRRDDRKLRASMECPKKSSHLAIAVQGRNAGVCTRFVAFGIDKGIAIGVGMLFMLIFRRLYETWESVQPATTPPQIDKTLNDTLIAWVVGNQLIKGELTLGELQNTLYEMQVTEVETEQRREVFLVVGLPILVILLFGFITDAFCLMVVGRTVGKVVMGLMVLNSHGGKVAHLTPFQATSRAFLTNLGIPAVAGAFVSWVREDRRGIIDICCSTTVVYAWDAKRYRLAEDDFAKDMPIFGDLESQRSSNESSRSHRSNGVEQPEAGILRRMSFRPRKYKPNKDTETLMISVPTEAMAGERNSIGRASNGEGTFGGTTF